MNKISMRRAHLADIPTIMELLRQVNEVHYQGRPDLFRRVTKYSAEQLADIIQSEDNPVFVVVSDDDNAQETVLAHLFCVTRDYSSSELFQDIKTLYIDDLCVSETARGMGIGRFAMDWICAWAREKGFYNVTLGVWECNPDARKFYEAMGMHVQESIMERILGR
ncbi:GNAT family N-acetyltransferase [Alloscardovia omnicolens]|uniref:GNAT family N-acetyltransferase n=1 Tax=Alloscardovia omnicolens TaxID=419015 RepID=UPI003A66C903